ncbi:MAG: hypothetical protein BroJett026_15010 [Betaproteobacteria bacterium]|nr:MAG: hypothetical protein BroJett026_15010 [Betaproteobacteria bacterium]
MPPSVRADSLRPPASAAGAPVARAASLVGIAAVASLVFHVGTASAEIKLLPPEEAFRYAARAVDGGTVEARFDIADGYYLYRDKLRFAVEPGPLAGGVALPAGKVKDDEFFGRVETYRDRVLVRIPIAPAAPGQSVTVQADSQGCADVGVCYPPVSQRITVVVPPAGGPAGAFVEASPAKKRWFR